MRLNGYLLMPLLEHLLQYIQKRFWVCLLSFYLLCGVVLSGKLEHLPFDRL